MTSARRTGIPHALVVLAGLALAAGGIAQRATASDGVIEINQAAIAARGGFPYVIDALGSYRLTSDLVIPDANTTAIRVMAPNVTLDLNGFAISGPTVCSGTPVTSCAPRGIGMGIDGESLADVPGIRVRNGTVRGMGATGVRLGSEAVVEDVIAVSNGGRGFDLSDSARLIRGFALRNGANGMEVGPGSIIRESIAGENAGSGIGADPPCLLARNVASGNVLLGIGAFPSERGSVYVENAASSNGRDGIVGLWGTVLSGNTANQNGISGIHCNRGCSLRRNTASRNVEVPLPGGGGNGIAVMIGCSVVSNTARANSAAGLSLILSGGSNGIARNVLTANTQGAIGIASGAVAIEMAPNVCGAALCGSP